VELAWQRLLAGQSGVRALSAGVGEGTGVSIAGRVPGLEEDPQAGWSPEAVISAKELRRMDRFIAFALGAADQALAHAQWAHPSVEQQERAATIIGSGVGGFSTIVEAVRTTDGKGPQRLSPFTVPAFLANLASGQVSIRHQLKGPLGAPVTACAASIQAIGDAARLIRNDEADMALCGGSEATIDRVALGSFAAAKAVTTFCGGDPAKASRPFDRHGTVLSWPKVRACWCWRHWIMHWRAAPSRWPRSWAMAPLPMHTMSPPGPRMDQAPRDRCAPRCDRHSCKLVIFNT
jgi:3-oxoacyl-[acyl-carrier-protein] synthase II